MRDFRPRWFSCNMISLNRSKLKIVRVEDDSIDYYLRGAVKLCDSEETLDPTHGIVNRQELYNRWNAANPFSILISQSDDSSNDVLGFHRFKSAITEPRIAQTLQRN